MSRHDAARMQELGDNVWTCIFAPSAKEAITAAGHLLRERWDEVEKVASAIVERFYLEGEPTGQVPQP